MKNKLYKNVIILICTGLIIKIIGLLNRILILRIVGEKGVLIYSLSFPTILLLLSLSQFGFPIAISTIVSKKGKNYTNGQIVKSSMKISIFLSISIIILTLTSLNFLTQLLHNDDVKYIILVSLPLIPLVSFTGILKGYFNGLNKIETTALSNTIEQITRFLFSVFVSIVLIPYGYLIAIMGTIIAISIGELSSLFFLFYKYKSIPKNKKNLTPKVSNVYKDILAISLPTTSSRLIGSFSYFLEPIIYTFALLSIGIPIEIINNNYVAINGYALPLLMISSFVSLSISTAIIPEISKNYSLNNNKEIKKTIDKALFFSFIPGLLVSISLYFFSKELLQLLFNTTTGHVYVKFLSPIFLLVYFQAIFTAVLQSIDKAKDAFISSLLSSILKLILIYTLSINYSITTKSLCYAISINIILTTVLHYYSVYKNIKYKICPKTLISGILISISFIYLTKILISYNLNFILICIILSFISLFLVIYNHFFFNTLRSD